MSALLSVDALACTLGTRRLFERFALTLQTGQWAMVRGENGSGKSTLLRALAGLITPAAGEIRWLGESIRTSPAAWHAALLYQGHAQGWKDLLSVQENLQEQHALDGGTGDVAEAILRVGLARQQHLMFQRLSAGQRRRVGLARLVLGNRPVWLLDEPATALDESGQELLGALIDAHLSQGGSAVIASHQPLRTTRAPIEVEIGQFAASPRMQGLARSGSPSP